MDTFIQRFQSIKTRYESQSKRDPTLVCKTGFYGNCPVLKLQKAAWTNDDMKSVPNRTGIFFSIWLDDQSIALQQIKYNIHALKLRELKTYKATSIDFAKEFRSRFAEMESDWPNIRVDFGPLTLMQGWIPLVEKTLDRDVLRLMNRFGKISPIIDEMLKSRARRTSGVVASVTTGGG
jgi:hypothetical protein